MRARVLIIDDDEVVLTSFKKLLRKENIDVVCAASPNEAVKIYNEEKMNFDLLLVDHEFKGLDISGSDLALRILRQNPDQAIIFMSGKDNLNYHIEMLKTGAGRTFIQKGGPPETIVGPVTDLLKKIKPRIEYTDTLEDELQRESDIRAFGIFGRSRVLHSIVKQVEKLRRFRSIFLIVGETGSGKEFIAKSFAIPGKPFFAVDCSDFTEGTEHFLESAMFGRIKGAYTGADSDQIGVFEAANGGVIFFDELHCMGINAQAKLLRAIQEMKFRRLGDAAGKEIKFDVTIVAAAKPVIYEMIEKEKFKSDLYYRLNRVTINIPNLASRPEDIDPIAKYFVRFFGKRHGLTRELHPQLIREFEAHSWPGNVRELEGVVDQLVMTSNDALIGPEGFREYLKIKKSQSMASNKKIKLRDVTAKEEAEQIKSALIDSDTIGLAASALSIPRTTLNDHMKKLNINPQNYLGIGRK